MDKQPSDDPYVSRFGDSLNVHQVSSLLEHVADALNAHVHYRLIRRGVLSPERNEDVGFVYDGSIGLLDSDSFGLVHFIVKSESRASDSDLHIAREMRFSPIPGYDVDGHPEGARLLLHSTREAVSAYTAPIPPNVGLGLSTGRQDD